MFRSETLDRHLWNSPLYAFSYARVTLNLLYFYSACKYRSAYTWIHLSKKTTLFNPFDYTRNIQRFESMNWVQRKIYLYNVTFGLYMLDWWERCLFNILVVVLMWFICYNGVRSANELCKSFNNHRLFQIMDYPPLQTSIHLTGEEHLGMHVRHQVVDFMVTPRAFKSHLNLESLWVTVA
ncbi:hypothetical protein RHGRI_023546 [Rhododendron griersonianum]|uniref:Uncharacterized protein n=1 Tax=Rhododendron griersonianum TaxID=479676 RepID=A0AAV6J7W1_9ERIC|nr:hypothetical protein RHGRI_023546 [Rhododendron griersonianum]